MSSVEFSFCFCFWRIQSNWNILSVLVLLSLSFCPSLSFCFSLGFFELFCWFDSCFVFKFTSYITLKVCFFVRLVVFDFVASPLMVHIRGGRLVSTFVYAVPFLVFPLFPASPSIFFLCCFPVLTVAVQFFCHVVFVFYIGAPSPVFC